MDASTTPAALVVDPDADHRAFVVNVVASAGFEVAEADSFALARRALIEHPPAVLITALKLAEYNGLHLVLRARGTGLKIDTLVIGDKTCADFRAEVQNAGAAFLVEWANTQELLAAVIRTLFRDDHTRPIEPPFERRVTERRAAHLGQVPDRRSYDRRRSMATLLSRLHSA